MTIWVQGTTHIGNMWRAQRNGTSEMNRHQNRRNNHKHLTMAWCLSRGKRRPRRDTNQPARTHIQISKTWAGCQIGKKEDTKGYKVYGRRWYSFISEDHRNCRRLTLDRNAFSRFWPILQSIASRFSPLRPTTVIFSTISTFRWFSDWRGSRSTRSICYGREIAESAIVGLYLNWKVLLHL